MTAEPLIGTAQQTLSTGIKTLARTNRLQVGTLNVTNEPLLQREKIVLLPCTSN